MPRVSLLLAPLALTAIPLTTMALPQESASAKRTFEFRTTESPADPDPQQQSDAERTETLRKRMREAKALFDTGRMEECFTNFVDPFWIARGAARSGWTVDELFDKQINAAEAHTRDMAQHFAKTIDSTLAMEPKWLLDGRVASFITDGSSHTAEFWIYFEGKWRISPET